MTGDRSRIFGHFSPGYRTSLTLIKLDGAIGTDFGGLVDLAADVRARRVRGLTVGCVDVIGLASRRHRGVLAQERACRVGPFSRNVTGPETVSVARLAHKFEG